MRYWIFQSNLEYYELEDALLNCSEVNWKTNNCNVRKGDVGYFYKCEVNAGIYAVGKVLTDPADMYKDKCEEKAIRKDDRREKNRRVRIKIIKKLEKPLSEQAILSDPILKNLNNLKKPGKSRRPIGSCFSMTSQQANLINSII